MFFVSYSYRRCIGNSRFYFIGFFQAIRMRRYYMKILLEQCCPIPEYSAKVQALYGSDLPDFSYCTTYDGNNIILNISDVSNMWIGNQRYFLSDFQGIQIL